MVDIKTGSRNGYVCLKFKGVERYSIYSKQPYQSLPKFFSPIKGCNVNFADLGDGDGRNDTLWKYILTLQAADFTVDEIRETIRIINKYVLKQPLSEQELEVILRDDAFKKQSFFKGTTFLFDKFSEFIKRESHIIKLNGRLHIYQDGAYTSDYKKIDAAMLKHIPQLSRAKRAEVMSYLDLMCENKQIHGSDLIAFRNGIYNLNDDSFSPLTPDVIITNMIPHNYNPASKSDLVDTVLNNISCGDEKIRALLEEMAGSCMYRSNTLAGGKAFILTGIGANGKSTFLDMLKAMLGENNFSSLDLNELSEKFQNAELFGKLANIGDDINSEYIPNVAIFRKLVTGERIQVQKKGQDPFEFNNYAKMMFSANNIPRMGGAKESYSIMRRLVIIPFNAKFTNDVEGYDPNIKYELRTQEAVEYLIQLGLKGLKRVLENKCYTSSKDVQEELNDFELRNNNIYAFVKECEAEDFRIENEKTNEVYKHYLEFCINNGIQRPYLKIEFSKQICKMLCFKTVQQKKLGEKYQVFISAVQDTG
ncbi:phage/plasmid primase, P4 family [Pelotomaculum terephthalicicum JT]|uniref:DNA primase family protein n=1 Tax=Pelotomaculum terephthalicicum TaxID=206393 RepID=UPI001F03BC3D|nr:phage/plasmid primase, P4 family [Pelotomaculum terephthalicicum]MCG9969949.1 phage/plasmid primase, P4 family [Pelotomaculum terephthalicicum JT]